MSTAPVVTTQRFTNAHRNIARCPAITQGMLPATKKTIRYPEMTIKI